MPPHIYFHPCFDVDSFLCGALARVVAGGSSAILPWAFGKWTRARKRLILEAMDQYLASISEIPEPDARGCHSRARFVAHRTGVLRTFAARTHFLFEAKPGAPGHLPSTSMGRSTSRIHSPGFKASCGGFARRLKPLERELRQRRSRSNRRLCNFAGCSANDDRNPAKPRTGIWADRILPRMRSRQ